MKIYAKVGIILGCIIVGMVAAHLLLILFGGLLYKALDSYFRFDFGSGDGRMVVGVVLWLSFLIPGALAGLLVGLRWVGRLGNSQ